MELNKLTTEQRNVHSMNLDTLSSKKVLELMNEEDYIVPSVIKESIPQIESTVEAVKHSFKKGGRLIYIGAGTSGRLGVLDAAECVPTFNIEPSMVKGIIAGGLKAMTVAVEEAEDSFQLGRQDLIDISLSKHDIVVGITASGKTPYVLGAIKYANSVGANTVSLACNENAEISEYSAIKIEVPVGPEILTGSTRLKAGSAQKIVLNMISTASMIGIGKVYKNLMVDVKATNKKLVERSKHIIIETTKCDYDMADYYLKKADKDVKLAIIMILTDLTKEEAQRQLLEKKGIIRNIVKF